MVDLIFKKSWICSACSSQNEPTAPQCIICDRISPDSWKCPKCSFLNRSLKCMSCGTTVPREEDDDKEVKKNGRNDQKDENKKNGKKEVKTLLSKKRQRASDRAQDDDKKHNIEEDTEILPSKKIKSKIDVPPLLKQTSASALPFLKLNHKRKIKFNELKPWDGIVVEKYPVAILGIIQMQFPEKKAKWSKWEKFLREEEDLETEGDLLSLPEIDFNQICAPALLKGGLRRYRDLQFEQLIQLNASEEAARLLAEQEQRSAQLYKEAKDKAQNDSVMAASMYDKELRLRYQTNTPFTCATCYTDFASDEKKGYIADAVFPVCGHPICKDCFTEYCKSQKGENYPKCYEEKCRQSYNPTMIGKICGNEVLELLDKNMLKQSISKDPNGKFCTTADCKGFGFVEADQNNFKCIICNKTNCLKCQIVHQGISCEQFQQWKKENDKAQELTEEFLSQNKEEYKKCPACKYVISKVDGCNFVVCAQCKNPLCWQTGKLRSKCGGGHECH